VPPHLRLSRETCSLTMVSYGAAAWLSSNFDCNNSTQQTRQRIQVRWLNKDRQAIDGDGEQWKPFYLRQPSSCARWIWRMQKGEVMRDKSRSRFADVLVIPELHTKTAKRGSCDRGLRCGTETTWSCDLGRVQMG
jgi:hypothetical protein